MKSKRLIILSLVLFFCTELNAQKNQTSKLKKHNFLFVLVDDQPFDAVGYSGRYPFLKTPNIDWLNKRVPILRIFSSLSLYVLHLGLASWQELILTSMESIKTIAMLTQNGMNSNLTRVICKTRATKRPMLAKYIWLI